MLLCAKNFRTVFWAAVVPGEAAVALLALGLREPAHLQAGKHANPVRRENLRRLSTPILVGVGAAFTLARFSEAFLVLRAQELEGACRSPRRRSRWWWR